VLKQLRLIDPSGAQCDGRAFCGVSATKGYVSSSNGMWILDLESLEIKGQVEGTANPNGSDGKPNTDPSGSLYHGQCGSMVRVGNRVFVAHQSEGLLVVDPYTDKVTDVLTMKPVYDLLPDPDNDKEKKMPGIGSVVLAKDGSLWVSVARDIQGTGTTLPYLMRCRSVFSRDFDHRSPRRILPPFQQLVCLDPRRLLRFDSEQRAVLERRLQFMVLRRQGIQV